MNKQTLRAISYVQNMLSFVFLDQNINNYINRVYLYGSAVRAELEEESDIDLFIDTDPQYEDIVNRILKTALSKFYNSRDYEKWNLLKFNYKISYQIGDLMKWQLKNSILSEGILLYSRQTEILPGKREVLFMFELPKDKNKYLHFIRLLFGRKEKGYKDGGFLKEMNGKKLSSNIIIVQKEFQKKSAEFFQKEKINYFMKEIFTFD